MLWLGVCLPRLPIEVFLRTVAPVGAEPLIAVCDRSTILSASASAEQLGVHEAYISQVMRAMRDVKLSTLDKMQREWNVLIEDLLKITEADLPRVAVWKARRKKQKSAETDQ